MAMMVKQGLEGGGTDGGTLGGTIGGTTGGVGGVGTKPPVFTGTPARDTTTMPSLSKIDTTPRFGMGRPLGSFKKGTSHVPKTGIYKLHEGEAVIPKEKNMDSVKDKMISSLGGDEKKPKKEVKEIRTRKGKSGGYIHEHHHTHPEHHPMEEHTSKDSAAMHDHMEEHMGEPNPGEAEADAGQHGIPDAQAAPASIPAPPAGAAPMPGV